MPDTRPAPDPLPPDVRQLVDHALNGSASIDAAQVDRIVASAGIDVRSLMIGLLPIAARHARVPVSGFRVGAVALGASGGIHLGANMEFVGEALAYAVHGEQSMITTAWLAGEIGIQAIAVNAAPCGHCRQFLHELVTPSDEIDILISTSVEPTDLTFTSRPLADLLPSAFGPEDLGVVGGLLQPEEHGLTTTATDPLALEALAAANRSYAPHTHDVAGCAIRLRSGAVYTGRLAENAAFNPSISPIASALASMNMTEPPGVPYDLEAAVLVEADAVVSQRSAVEAVLASVAPGLELGYVRAEPVEP